ncbi:MAG: PTS fructose transporter subunit IIA [Desulfuromonadales bacterium GWD2_61_12]|nr:MAG: PTS fructose transporter subunit IIA [Desulfuromonadales bacterium GWD2_61_12]HBT82268.1 PTS fructose transporter subunit IIA [Desulfuromonas sp.]
MKISDLLESAAIAPDLRSTGKLEILSELATTLVKVEPGLSREEILRVLLERERLGSTGIGDGVAIPHGKLKQLDRLLIAFGRHRQGVDFDSMDGKPTHLFFLLVAPEDSVGIHLKALARISKLLKSPGVRQRLVAAGGSDDILTIINEEEEKLP